MINTSDGREGGMIIFKDKWKCRCTGNEVAGDYSRMEIFEYEGETYQVDSCMVNEIKWLLKQGVTTIESCCGHHFVIDGKEVEGYIFVSKDSIELMRRLGYEKYSHPLYDLNDPVTNQFFKPKTK